jgi:hypothetical protein
MRCAPLFLLLVAAPRARAPLVAQSISRRELGAMAIGGVTSAAPALLGRRLTEGYLTQPNLMGAASVGGLRATGTLNAEGYTLRRGELNAGIYGEGYVDRRHPHTLVHEAMLAAVTPAVGAWRASLAVGKGFTPYGTDDPMMRPFMKYPVNHHHAQIIERVQAVGAVRLGRDARHITIEQAWFNGDEPTSPFAAPRWQRVGDSHSTRLTVGPSASLEWQASRAFVRSPGITQGGAFDHRQLSTSLRYAAIDEARWWRYGLVEFARTDEGFGRQRVFRFESVLAEGAVAWCGWSLAVRAERTERPEHERLLDLFRTNAGHIDFSIIGVTRWHVGTVQLAAPAWMVVGMRLRPFVEVARAAAEARRTPAVFIPSEFYGASRQWSVTAGTRVHVGSMRARMGRYGVLDAALAPTARPLDHGHLHAP